MQVPLNILPKHALLRKNFPLRLAAPASSLNLVRGSLDLFQVLLQEALPNLKERKYLRGWIQVTALSPFSISYLTVKLARLGYR